MQTLAEERRPARPIAGNTATGWLKLLALLFMFIDHAGKMLFPGVPEMRIIGRIAFPLYCWCMVVGFHYTRSVPKYLLRILIAGVISQPLYMVALAHSWYEPNIMLTLFVALLALWGIREKWHGSQWWGPVLAIVMAEVLGCNYGWRGVMLVMVLYAARHSRGAIAAVMCSFCLAWGGGTVTRFFGLNLTKLVSAPLVSKIASPWLHLQTLAVLSLPLMLIRIPREKDVRMPAWLSYALYPAHLALLWGLEQFFHA